MDGGEVGREGEEGKGATSGRGAKRQRAEVEEDRGARGHRRQGETRPRGIKAGRGVERQQAKKKGRGGKRQKEGGDRARARLEQQASSHRVPMEPEEGEDQVGRWVRDCSSEAWWRRRKQRRRRTGQRCRYVAMDVFAGTQSMGPVYCQRTGVKYIPLDERVEVYSAAQQKTVRNIPFNIMEDTAKQTLVIVVRELKRRRPGVKRMRQGEVWLSPPCNTFCKMDSINKEHQCRDSGDPLRKPIEGTEKGDLAKEADELMRKALLLITYLACMKDTHR